jgi:hypothetical protein
VVLNTASAAANLPHPAGYFCDWLNWRVRVTVLRLKGGDPFMFGRGGEGVRLAKAKIPFRSAWHYGVRRMACANPSTHRDTNHS